MTLWRHLSEAPDPVLVELQLQLDWRVVGRDSVQWPLDYWSDFQMFAWKTEVLLPQLAAELPIVCMLETSIALRPFFDFHYP